MKRILLALTMVGLLLPLAQRAQADTEVSLDFFYDNLSPYGDWIEVADYGYCFQPSVAVSSTDWRPYADGYWAYTDVGWTWVSYEDFGWATYHYGRWANLDDYGWVWVPGYDWGPAWVSWRTGGDYVGWAPLPPQPVGVVYEGGVITGAVDITFGIGPLYYNFVDIRYIGEPVLRGRLIDRGRNVTIINNTVNVTNITYNNSTVINNGPDLNRVNQFSARPIQRMKLQRETNLGGDVAGRRGNLNRVNGDTLVVAAPAVQRTPKQLAPKQVKARVDKPKFEKGWQGVNNRQQVEQEMKKENAQNVRPPTFQPQKGRKLGAAAASESNAGNADNAGNAGNAGIARDAVRPHKGNRLGQPQTLQRDTISSGDGSVMPPVERANQEKETGMKKLQGPNRLQQPNGVPQRAEPARRALQPQQTERVKRIPQAQPPQQVQGPERVRRPLPAAQPERAQRPQLNRPPAQALPQQPQQDQNPNAERQGKKKKPGEEPQP